ncbi:MAG: heparan-alpha-glucosaminide N-acetyltransferase domain-containing protein [Dermatophilus congolensis]|nr:heparan-alpha-glucosaminide N-acetyltransferase domain-containing protein [Dermatophilus congolensis]
MSSTTSQPRPEVGPEPGRSEDLTPAHPLPVGEAEGTYDEWSTRVGDDVLEESDYAKKKRLRGNRLIGLDAARGIALIGMVAVHTMSAENADGDLSMAWWLASGKSAALFAVLGGVGLAFMSGRRRPPRGAEWGRGILRQIIRAIVIFAVGLALGEIVPIGDVSVILPYLGALFAVASLLLPLRGRVLLPLGLIWAVASPFLSHWLRLDIAAPETQNLTFGSLLAAPGDDALRILLTGAFPVLTWLSYIMIGMGLGRAHLASRRTAAYTVVGGVVLTVAAAIATWILVAQVGVRSHIAADVMGRMPLETYTDYLVFGADGTSPTSTWWWLGVNSPHMATPLDLLYTSGIAITVIGVCLVIAQVTGSRMSLLAVPGSMTLTLYSLHLVLIELMGDLPDLAHFLGQVVILTAFALVWSRFAKRGPLESALAWLTKLLVPSPAQKVHSDAEERWSAR